jgi:hypothetical protein
MRHRVISGQADKESRGNRCKSQKRSERRHRGSIAGDKPLSSIIIKIDARIKALAHQRFGILRIQLVVKGHPASIA